MKNDWGALREQALANIEALFNMWGLEWRKISDYEYDFKNPTRNDQNFGACRFNALKNLGSDFALPTFDEQDYALLGPGFTKEDFAPVSIDFREQRSAFDIIGLLQRINKLGGYNEAAEVLRKHLVLLRNKGNIQDSAEALKARESIVNNQRLYLLKRATQVWSYCVPVPGTIGENYLYSRAIESTAGEPNMRFHPKVKNKEANRFLPAIIFKVATAPDQELVALHRIYLDPTGCKKADLVNQKMAMGSIKGAGIWFGTPGPKLYIAEGPENALSLRTADCDFVVSSVFAGNFSSLVIPEYVELVILAGDSDKAGEDSAVKAARSYAIDQKKVVKIIKPKKNEDWNSALMADKGRINA